MPVQGSMQSLTAVAASNSPAGSDSISNTLDDYLRSLSGVLRFTEAYAASLTATASMSLAAATGAIVPVEAGASATSAVTVSHLGTVAAGRRWYSRWSIFRPRSHQSKPQFHLFQGES